MEYLFEGSWEVCNKVGGIYAVLRSKVAEAAKVFNDRYYLLGPYLGDNPEFRETQEDEFSRLRPALEKIGLRCQLGRWKVPGEPKTILIDFREHREPNELLYSYWRDFGVDSYAGRWDYIEPILFSTACGEAIAAVSDVLLGAEDRALAHFHEWLMGGGVLHLKRHRPAIATVFTAHSTVLGRCMAGLGRDIHLELDTINPRDEAQTYGISAKHNMESTAAREADCFVTVSALAAMEAEAILGRRSLVVENGLNAKDIPDYSVDRLFPTEQRAAVLATVRNIIQKDLPAETKLWVTAGRYEFHNKGYNTFLESLGELDRRLRGNPQAPPVVALLYIPANHRGVQESVSRRVHHQESWDPSSPPCLTTHRLHDEQNDPIIKTCLRLGLRNQHENKVHIVFSPDYLDCHDGIFNQPYHNILSACDLGVFPSFYDPWGYTPLESITYAVPTVTSDLSGFGNWAEGRGSGWETGVFVLRRKGRESGPVVHELTEILEKISLMEEHETDALRRRSRSTALELDWSNLYGGYQNAYQDARAQAARRADQPLPVAATVDGVAISFTSSQHSETPRFRRFTAASSLPKEISGLHDIAHNLWWSWNPDARELFNEIDEQLWVKCGCNPVQFLNEVSNEVLEKRLRSKGFMSRYQRVHTTFQQYMGDNSFPLERHEAVSPQSPIVYFSLEYGLHECLPIYSGGLGVLSGDHLKAASDLNLPLIGIGLLYRHGYFRQLIDRSGMQQEQYPPIDCASIPVEILNDGKGQEVRVATRLPGRAVQARVWVVQVGRIKLYLLDSDLEENEPGDRSLTHHLYGGDRRNRIKQEILISICGVKLLEDVLALSPAVYHLNEGHCAFLLMERIKRLMTYGLSFEEAREAVKASTVFTTHTPVPAGNEVFDLEIISHYLRDYINDFGITWEQFVELGKENPHDHQFSMTVLALKLSSKANGVAKLHGKVSRDMWKNIWKGVNREEIPIFSITNGIHLQTFCSAPMRRLFDKYLDIKWGRSEDNPEVWEKVTRIPDEELWAARLEQKTRFINRIKDKIAEDYARRGEDPQLIRNTIQGLSPNNLTIGFARRFATYKRGALFLKDWERIRRIVSNPDRPVQLLIAGKAHPADVVGKEVIQEIVNASRAPELQGRVIFLENYNMGIARLLTRGCDVWLNNPIRPMEASGTSGMKLGPNGGLNFSILDGWWDEGYQPEIGWKIDPGAHVRNREHQDELDNIALLDTLENQIVPLYYQQEESGFSPEWLRMVKASIESVSCQFNTLRMVKQYYTLSYLPTAERHYFLKQNDYQDIKELTAWKRLISSRFATIQIPKVQVKGIRSDDLLEPGGDLEVDMYVYPGKLRPKEIRAEFVVGRRQGDEFADMPEIVEMELEGNVKDSDILRYRLRHRVSQAGNYLYAVRVVPIHPLLSVRQETGLMCWG